MTVTSEYKMYFQLVEKSLQFLITRLLQFFDNKEPDNEYKWAKKVRKCYKAMKKMESCVQIEQKLSHTFSEL